MNISLPALTLPAASHAGVSVNANVFENRNLLDLAILLEEDDAMFWLINEKDATPSPQNVEAAKASPNKAIKVWGHQYGTFLNRYDVENFKNIIHESPTCHVFGVSEIEIEKEGASSKEKKSDLILKIMNNQSGW